MAHTIDERYAAFVATPSDINTHLPTLRRYAAATENGEVAEYGVRGVVSTWALLRGLLDRGRPGAAMWSLDLEPCPGVADATAAAAAVGIRHTFVQHDSATYRLPQPVDLLFIDTWHVYGHLRRELAQHADSVRQWIILHDTEGDRDVGESVRLGHDLGAMSKASGYPEHEINVGLRRAVLEFLLQNADWDVVHHTRLNNGLTVLARRTAHALPCPRTTVVRRGRCHWDVIPLLPWVLLLLVVIVVLVVRR